ncbi:methyltransferase [Streptomyces mirabilis]|uniref:methyltransferase n=1 Tax=Streptomyces mirabilis TaxID=68239 RepID=UPI0036988C6B
MGTQEQPSAVLPADVYLQMSQMVTSHWIPQVVRAAIDLSLADHLADRGLTADEVAQREDSAPTTTFRLMRACVAAGLLTADKEGRFFSTPLLATLRKDAPGSLRGLALATTLPAQWLSWNEFTASVRKGETQVEVALGTTFFDYLEKHPSQARDFSEGLTGTTSLWAAEVAKSIDTTGVQKAVDLGGANGSLLHLLQEANPDLRGIVFDRPNIVEDAAAETERKGLADRTEVLGGDFFESVPAADLYLLKFILHDWDDERCVTILRNCREAMTEGGRITVVELIVGELDAPGFGALMDMNMLANQPGRERSLEEYDVLLAKAGLRRTQVLTSNSPQSVIEAVAL